MQASLPAPMQRFQDYPAVTVAVAKRKGTNAVWVSEEILKEAERFAREVLPEGVHIAHHQGLRARPPMKRSMIWWKRSCVAIAIVVILLAYTLGWREGIIIALAVPVTFSFTLLDKPPARATPSTG